MSVHLSLRRRTAACHDAVDAAFARFDLADAASYATFLDAHARALLPAEAALAEAAAGLPVWRPRGALLRGDLAVLGCAVPPPLTVDPPAGTAAAFGMLYVLEGSRLGGAMLARRVDPALPADYLNAAHRPGEWRALRDRLDDAGAAGGTGWEDAATAGAEATFALFLAAARNHAAA